MSFILEALKKSERKNRQGAAPGLETIHEPLAGSGASRSKWVWLLLPALLLNGGLLLWLFGPWAPQTFRNPPPGQAPAVLAQPAANQPPAPLVGGSAPALAPPGPTPAAAPVPPAPARRLEKLPREGQPVRPNPTPSAAAAPVSPASAPLPEQRIYALAELPLSLRTSIPELEMSLHAFNRDSSSASLVRINGQILREGALLADHLLLEKITAEGAVFSSAGYRFLAPRRGYSE
jgi:hypothetical protein